MTHADLDTFEAALLHELRAHVEQRASVPVVRRPFGRSVATLAAAAAVIAAVSLASVTFRPSPAVAVERGADGDGVVTVTDWSQAEGLEQALAEQGVTADVEYLAGARRASDLSDGGPSAGCAIGEQVTVDPADGACVTFTLDAGFVSAHDSVLHVIAAGGEENGWSAVSVAWNDKAC